MRKTHGPGRAAIRLAAVALAATLGAAACGSDRSPSPGPTGSPTAETAGNPTGAPNTASPSGAVAPSPIDPPESPGGGAPQTAADLILAAEAAGRLDAPTALLYRVYAIFGDPRLPAEFEGGSWSEDDTALDDAADMIESLPEAVAIELRPFLVRPTDPDSVFFGPADTASGPLRTGPQIAAIGAPVAAAFADVTCTQSGFGYADGTAPFRVWGKCERDELDMQGVAAWMDELWSAEVAYMGRAPLPDEGGADQGGNADLGAADRGATRIDVYLTTNCVTRGGECVSPKRTAVTAPSPPAVGTSGARRKSGYLVVNRGILGDATFARAVLAHELFHLIQRAYNTEGTRDGAEKNWFVEASAVWAQWRFVPAAANVDDTTMTPARFDGFQGTPLSLQNPHGDNDYWSFPWPLFMEQAAASAVADAWKAIEGKQSTSAVTRAVDGRLSFATKFRDFAVRAYNRAWSPTQDADLRKLLPAGAVGDPRVEPGLVKQDDKVTLHADLPGVESYRRSELFPSLSARYRPFDVDDDVGRITVDTSGLSPSGAYDVDALLKIKDKGWERRKLDPGSTTFCLDKPAEHIEEMVIVLSNHQLDPLSQVFGDWTIESLQVGCAPLTGVLTIERTASYLQLDSRLPYERHDEDLKATIVVNMRPDPDTGGYRDAYDPADPTGARGSTYTISRSTSAEKQLGDCTSSYSTESTGTWRFSEQPTGPDWENSITGFFDRASGIAMFSIVVHYPYRVIEDICNIITPVNAGVHDAYICTEGRYVEVDGGPDRIEVHCTSDAPGMGYSKMEQTIDGTLTLLNE